MRLIGTLKKQVEATGSKEEAKEVIAQAGMELNDEELNQISGGTGGNWGWDSVSTLNGLPEVEKELKEARKKLDPNNPANLPYYCPNCQIPMERGGTCGLCGFHDPG